MSDKLPLYIGDAKLWVRINLGALSPGAGSHHWTRIRKSKLYQSRVSLHLAPYMYARNLHKVEIQKVGLRFYKLLIMIYDFSHRCSTW